MRTVRSVNQPKPARLFPRLRVGGRQTGRPLPRRPGHPGHSVRQPAREQCSGRLQATSRPWWSCLLERFPALQALWEPEM